MNQIWVEQTTKGGSSQTRRLDACEEMIREDGRRLSLLLHSAIINSGIRPVDESNEDTPPLQLHQILSSESNGMEVIY